MNVLHCFANSIHKLGLHRFKCEHNTLRRGNLNSFDEIFKEKPFAFFSAFFIINIVTCELNHTHANCLRKINSTPHYIHGALSHRR